MKNPRDVTIDVCRTRFVEALRKFVGPGKVWSVNRACDDLDIDTRSMHAYILGENFPPFVKFIRMCKLFGPGFINPILRLAGLDGAYCQDPETVTDFELNSDLSKTVAAVAAALRDGRIDHRDRLQIVDELRGLISEAQSWLAANDMIVAHRNPCDIDTTPSKRG